jgi:hypothetical protein
VHDTLVPAWISEIAAQDEVERLQSELNTQRSLAAAKTIMAAVPGYILKLSKELSLQAGGLKTIGVNGIFSDFSEAEFESRYRVQVSLSGALVPRFTHTTVFHLAGSTTVRCLTLGGKAFSLNFSVDNQFVGLVSERQVVPMDAEEAAKLILKPMVEWVRGRDRNLY